MPRSKKSASEVFISHSSKDRTFIARLARVLKKHKIDYWYSATHIVGAKQWHDEIGHALSRCVWFLVVLTPNAVQSAWVKRELLFALNDERYNEKMIPILRQRCDYRRLSWALPEFQFVDFTGNFDDGCRQLLRIWGIAHKAGVVSKQGKGNAKLRKRVYRGRTR